MLLDERLAPNFTYRPSGRYAMAMFFQHGQHVDQLLESREVRSFVGRPQLVTVSAFPSAGLTPWIKYTGAARTAYRQLRVIRLSHSPCDTSSSSYPRISPMVAFDPLQQLQDLDRSSPQFHDQLSDLLRGEEYRSSVLNLQGDDLAWLVEYLDSVSLQFILVRPCTQRRCRSSPPFLLLQATRSKNACMNSQIYVALGRFYQHRVRFQTLF